MAKKKFNAVDLFAGAGGLSLGLELAGINVVGSVEYCPKAVKTYEFNFPDHVAMCKDITKFKPEEMEAELINQKGITKEEIDIIAGGPPCPGFSNIGRSKIISLLREGNLDKWSWGEDSADQLRHTFIQDPRNELFLEFVKYVEHFQPRWYIMENVPGMLTSKVKIGKKKNVVVVPKLVKQAFNRIGYECEIKALWANDYGVPQTRKRLIFLGWKKDRPDDRISHPLRNIKRDITSAEAINDLPFVGQDGGDYLDYKGELGPATNTYQKDMRSLVYKKSKRKDPKSNKIPSGKETAITCHFGRKVNPRDRAIFPRLTAKEGEHRVTYDQIDPEECDKDFRKLGWQWDKKRELVWNGKHGKEEKTYKWYNRKSFKDKMRRISGHKPSPTLVAHMAVDTYMYVHPTEDRTITPREAARIQSFPDSFHFSEVSFTSQYRQIGNAVPPLMGKAIGEEITKKA
jgi:DNA (cytosine-5)-methyltransferase 1